LSNQHARLPSIYGLCNWYVEQVARLSKRDREQTRKSEPIRRTAPKVIEDFEKNSSEDIEDFEKNSSEDFDNFEKNFSEGHRES
jgi:hypothetical protein